MKHTPGPWAISKHATPEHSPQFGVYPEGGRDLAIVKGDNAKADAKLIAAAPDLLDALRACAAFIENNGTTEEFFIVRDAWRNAIAEATP
jgi:hypothetical protein